MSRGHGRIERALLAVLDAADDHLNTFDLTADVFHPEKTGGVVGVTDAQLSAVRRALGKLTREGHVVPVGHSKTSPGRGWHDRRAHWISARALPAYRQREEALAAAIAASHRPAPLP